MIIENAELLKSWLSAALRPLCDADPAALAKYVLALIKKDKPDGELRQGMLDQLEVFLQQDTVTFVDNLFEALESKAYLTAKELNSSEKIEPQMDQSTTSALSSSPLSTTASKTDLLNTSSTSTELLLEASFSGSDKLLLTNSKSSLVDTDIQFESPLAVLNIASSLEEVSAVDVKKVRSTSSSRKDRMERDKARRKSRSPMRRSRSRSRDRGRRSFSPKDHPRPGHYRGRAGIRRSPGRRYDRDVWDRLDRRRSPGARNRSPSPRTRSRTPPRYRRTYDANRGRSRSPLDRNRERSRDRGNHRATDNLDVKPTLQSQVVKVPDATPRNEPESSATRIQPH